MVLEFQVLKCFSCQVFQVHQVYGQGTGADCRHHVQKLNLLQGQTKQAATGTAGESCQNAISDHETGDETEQGLLVLQEEAHMSRWNKYLEENSDETHEEEEGPISTDHEHYYTHQDCPQTTTRKRKQLPDHGGHFFEEDVKENITKKKNKIYEDGTTSRESQIASRKIEDTGFLKWHSKPILPLQSSSHTFFPMHKSEGQFKESTCSTASFLKRESKIDPVFNNFDHRKKIGSDCSVTSHQDVLQNHRPTATYECPAQMSSPRLQKFRLCQQSDGALKTTSSSLQKPLIQSNLFQTDEDFDENY
ncbi:MRN complex-interacting protein isoform X2 [Rhinoderma darwinii]|uniref:MRN complex-interacting protein isoform X2 n=1 Tax=Rhinoderma darwinii TaxID=43563 RepID=UPI003F67CEE1